MASYDSPGYVDKTPAGPISESTGAPGSASVGAGDTDSANASLEAGTVGNSALVTMPSTSLVNADRVEVSPTDVLVSSQAASYGADLDPLTGIGAELGQTGAGMGHVTGPRHPNSANPGEPS